MSENNFLNIFKIQRVISPLSQHLIQIDKSMQNWQSGVGYLRQPLVMSLKAHFWQWIISDQPININGWQPRNIDRHHLGLLTLIEAIRRSRNVATVRLMEKIGQKPVVELAKNLGITTTQKWQNEPGLALGTGEVRLIDMVSANAVFANGGYKVSPYGILGIRDKKGNLLYWRNEDSIRRRLVKDKYIAALNQMLRTVVSAHGTGANAAFGNHQTAGKTGTTNNYRDAWFIGYTAHLVTGVWVGNDNPTEFMNRVTGGQVPANIFRNFMANVHQGLESKPLLALK
jgi:penicillin-binding protein 1A